MKYTFSLLMLCLLTVNIFGQRTEAGDVIPHSPRDGFYDKENVKTKRLLQYDHVREADVFWEKRVWRVIDTREKMNKHFVYPEAPFVKILLDAAKSGEITVYSTMDDQFSYPLAQEDVHSIIASSDTIEVPDVNEPWKVEIKVISEELNWNDIKRFRVKEAWYFDEETSTMKVRILGIAPLKEVYDDNDNFRYEQPLFWVYYPHVRKVLAREEVVNPVNDANPMSWDDIFEMRYFSSYLTKESNVYNRRIQDYKSGMDIYMEAKKIEDAIFDFEQDLWSH